MFKRLVLFLTVISILFCFSSCQSEVPNTSPLKESEYIKSGIDEETNFKYDEYEDYIVITGIKTNPDDIEIPEKINNKEVCRIKENAFNDMGWVMSISMPDTVVEIGESAFYGCISVTEIDFSDNLYSIGASAFFENISLTDVRLPLGVKVIGSYAFAECRKLENIFIPESTSSIGGGAFLNTKWLNSQEDEFVIAGNHVLIDYNGKSVGPTIPDGIIEVSAFCDDTTIKLVVYSDSVERIGDHAFANSMLTSVSLPDKITSIGISAFECCLSLESVKLPLNLKTIGAYAFSGCQSLTEIMVPKKTETIGNNAFQRCDSLKVLEILSDKTEIGENICMDCDKDLKISCPKGSDAVDYAKENNFVLDII